MIEELKEIKKLRNKFNLNQKELADKAGVSQSLIAKIEAGKIEPTFTKAKQIFQALEELQEKEEIKAKDVMQRRVIFASVDENLKDIIKKIKSKGISQIPVMRKNNVCGIITESIILKKISERPEDFSSIKVEDAMEDTPPIISSKTGIKTLLKLLQEYSIVLVAEKGEIKGIISKTDLLGSIK
ncbi:MAG: CBS domain-containing protein [Nanoarchaeota archaeon]|nr:CBS domain-containing protein [Nanoarchaeota archaeon]MBU1632296.1 CBS domain-containing protein [Nanoarchaeota archaeon]MBU1875899.1 CBS domain-containing protein [Nanoarchaeota archaeon]